MERILISLIGGRPVPNIMAVFHLKPDKLYFVVSEDSMGKGGNYQKAVEALTLKPVGPFSVNPYSLHDTIECCRKIAIQHKDDEIIINSASEPKMMAFGAYEVAQKLRQEGLKVDMCYVGNDGYLSWIFEDSRQQITIDLKTYFQTYGWNITLKEELNPKLANLSLIFTEDLTIYQRLLQSIRHKSQGKEKRGVKIDKVLADNEFLLLQKIERLGIISNLKINEHSTSFTINSQEDGEFLLKGDWLEQYVYEIASKLKLFEECAWSVKDNRKGEIDFVGILKGQLVIASCKTEDSIERKWFEEIHSKAEMLGKGMCSKLLFSTVSKASRTEDTIKQYEFWASERQVVLILAEDIPNLNIILHKIALNKKDEAPRNIPCYPRI